MENLNLVVLALSVFLILLGLVSLVLCSKERKHNKYRKEYHSLQQLKAKMEYYNIKLEEVSEGLYKFTQCTKSGKPVFRIRKSGKGIDFVKITNDTKEHKRDVMTASHLNNILKIS